MKSKKLTYVLIIVVALIWYKVFFKVKANLFGEEVLIENVQRTEDLRLLMTQKDTVELKLNYRDPFGVGSLLPDEVEEIEVETMIAQPIKIIWPSVKYVGRVQKTESKNPLAILQIDGVQLFVRKKEELFDDFKIIHIGRDSVEIKYMSESKIFWRN